MNKTKILIISIIISIALFIGLIAVEKKLVNYTPTVKVVYCVKDIKRKEPLKPEYFNLRDVPITSIDINTIKSIDAINGMYAKENIYSNEPLNRNRIGSMNDIDSYILNSGEREMGISFDNIADCVGGTIRKDDVIDIIYTSTAAGGMGAATETKLQGIRVLGAVDASGKHVDATDKDTSAVTLIIAVTPQQGHMLASIFLTGKIKLFKVPYGDKEYKNITVQNEIVIP